MRPVLSLGSTLLIAAGIAALGWCGFELGRAHVVEQRAIRHFEARRDMGVEQNPASPSSVDGAIGVIDIPRLGVRSAVFEGDDELVLSVGVGHVPGTAMPGAAGNAALAGHRDTVFRALQRVRQGDHIRVRTARGLASYEVDGMRVVTPDDLGVLRPSGMGHELTLITCYPFSYIGAAPYRFVVHAHQVDTRAQS